MPSVWWFSLHPINTQASVHTCVLAIFIKFTPMSGIWWTDSQTVNNSIYIYIEADFVIIWRTFGKLWVLIIGNNRMRYDIYRMISRFWHDYFICDYRKCNLCDHFSSSLSYSIGAAVLMASWFDFGSNTTSI